MPGFELEQVDGDSPIDLPYGETLLGRGPFLGVNDKRVSRNHGILENQNGQLRLKPTHLNPCFIQTNIVATPQPLEKDQWHTLREGDIFSLMPGKYVYRVHVKDEFGTLRNSQMFEEEMGVEKCLTEPVEPSEESAKVQAKSQSSTLPGNTQDGASHSYCSLNEEPTVSKRESDLPHKKRVLPAWMMTLASATKSPSSAKDASSSVKGTPTQRNRAAASKQAAGPKRARTAQLSSEEEEEEEDEMPARKAKRLKSDSEEESETLDATKPQSSKVASVPDEPSPESDSTSLMECDNGKRSGGDPAVDVRQGAQAEDSKTQAEESGDSQVNQGPSQAGPKRSNVTESECKTSVSKVKKQRRTPCPYGGSCYRKNPVHFQESSHPGDSDYEEEEADDDDDDGGDDRPECPYGTHCYRKNLLHKKEYKHTKSPPKNSPDDENEDHYEDSFINDESEEEEVDEDSDYAPESDDSGKEDIKRLQKEAKAFLRKKK
ncbi:aprataxin and PNK-like factor [Xyrauchen texanus]|uniref:aprataxin and PNK-like factor n=1 Tax=Xyrauchen texanus TaxID=154827 RepID=UPI002242BBFB|nr:aprataxin and PNK-like factor [Xyrauchen texanus]XP_051983602.1 aprataxin and PNK-like factor [Xyrauchen texanus]